MIYHNFSLLKLKNKLTSEEFIDIDKHPIYNIKVLIMEDNA